MFNLWLLSARFLLLVSKCKAQKRKRTNHKKEFYNGVISIYGIHQFPSKNLPTWLVTVGPVRETSSLKSITLFLIEFAHLNKIFSNKVFFLFWIIQFQKVNPKIQFFFFYNCWFDKLWLFWELDKLWYWILEFRTTQFLHGFFSTNTTFISNNYNISLLFIVKMFYT